MHGGGRWSRGSEERPEDQMQAWGKKQVGPTQTGTERVPRTGRREELAEAQAAGARVVQWTGPGWTPPQLH